MKANAIAIDRELTIHYEESGGGTTTVLLLPGWTMSTRVYEHQLNFFKGSNDYRFITLDPRAHGLSTKTEGGHFYEQHGRDLHTFIEKLQLDSIVLGGWSFGTLAALSYVHQFGAGRLRGFVMLDGPPRATGKDNLSEWVSYSLDDADGSQEFFALGKFRDRGSTNIAFAKWMLEDKSAENIERLLAITRQTPDTAAALLNATAVFLDYRKDLIALHEKLPLMYYVRMTQEQIVRSWAERNTPTARIHASGEHLMFWERADEFNEILLAYLQST